MERLSDDEINYLIAVNASEESSLFEIHNELNAWEIDEDTIYLRVKDLLQRDIIAFAERLQDKFKDLDMDSALNQSLETQSVILYLTSMGEKVWENYDWGITTKRARELLFSNKGNNKHVQ